RRIGIVDRLILTHHTAQFLGQRAGARFQRRVRNDFVWLDSNGSRHNEKREQCGDEKMPQGPYSAGDSAALLRAGLGAPTRRRRSESDSTPPMAMTTAPNQMSSTSGL